jgi:hypothetical protein
MYWARNRELQARVVVQLRGWAEGQRHFALKSQRVAKVYAGPRT